MRKPSATAKYAYTYTYVKSYVYTSERGSSRSDHGGFPLKPAGHLNAKAFVKPVMHCRPINVTFPWRPAEEAALRLAAEKRAPAPHPPSLETRKSICVRARTHGSRRQLSHRSVGRTFWSTGHFPKAITARPVRRGSYCRLWYIFAQASSKFSTSAKRRSRILFITYCG